MAESGSWEDRIHALQEGNLRALSRMITAVENREPGWHEAMKRIYPLARKACVIGITGSPGAGKSTLTSIISR
ncbi:methylmalonyl Co-A mutase-associated GTPase MeaB, partial [bacterium]|nr:methylmalonyl Co-A mutase-associated GTPase MeaB [bacterium]